MKFRIHLYGEPILREKSKPVVEFDSVLKVLVTDMLEVLKAYELIGLAANQIGLAKQLAVIDLRVLQDISLTIRAFLDGKPVLSAQLFPLVLVNPIIEVTDGALSEMAEGSPCFPGVSPKISRPHGVKINYQDVEGAHHVLECDGILSRCAQHEVDHLNGILIIDQAGFAESSKFESKLKKIKREARNLLKQEAKDAKGK